MKYKVKGKLTKISEVKKLDNGASIVDYVLEHTSDNGYVTPYAIGMYKKAEFSEHCDNFSKYNKVGDEVEVTFTIRGSEYNGKIYNNLSHWECSKVESTIQAGENVPDLPF